MAVLILDSGAGSYASILVDGENVGFFMKDRSGDPTACFLCRVSEGDDEGYLKIDLSSLREIVEQLEKRSV